MGVHPRSVILGVLSLLFPGNKQTNQKTFNTKVSININSSISMQLQITDQKKETCIHAKIVHEVQSLNKNKLTITQEITSKFHLLVQAIKTG